MSARTWQKEDKEKPKGIIGRSFKVHLLAIRREREHGVRMGESGHSDGWANSVARARAWAVVHVDPSYSTYNSQNQSQQGGVVQLTTARLQGAHKATPLQD